MVGKQRDAQILVYLPVTYQGAPVAKRRHLDGNTCNLRTWLRAVTLHAGQVLSIMGRMSCLYSRTLFLTDGSLFIFRKGLGITNL